MRSLSAGRRFGKSRINSRFDLNSYSGRTSVLLALEIILNIKTSPKGLLFMLGDSGASRTHNLFLRTELLYPLSYGAIFDVYML